MKWLPLKPISHWNVTPQGWENTQVFFEKRKNKKDKKKTADDVIKCHILPRDRNQFLTAVM